MNANVEKLLNAVIASLDPTNSTSEVIAINTESLAAAYGQMNSCTYSDDDKVFVKRKVESIVPHTMSLGDTLKDESHKAWLYDKKEHIEPYYWNRYKNLLKEKLPPKVIDSIDRVNDEILDLLQDPKTKGKWIRKGLVVGDVQSGKTANFIALSNKAFDSGYRLVIILSGLLNSLRTQTQQRFDEGVIGLDSSILLSDSSRKDKLTGVGKYSAENIPVSITTIDADFNVAYSKKNQQALEQYSKPVVFVVKKNVSIIKNLIDWFKNNNFDLNQYPMLLIDDESDHASINTNKEDVDPTKTNERIRELLALFSRKVYLGYTATPFANIFIDPDTPEDMMDDLFPEHFIKVLDPPSNYFGPNKIYLNESSDFIRTIDDHQNILPIKHKINHIVERLPLSLEKAIRNFILVIAIRILRGDALEHNSMLVNVSRFTGIQSGVCDLIYNYLTSLQDSIKGYYALPAFDALKNNHMKLLNTLFVDEYSDIEYDWDDVQSVLNKAASTIETIEVNGSPRAEKIIDYTKKSFPNGRSLIAIGGFSLSRGITIESLSITYFLRNSFAYDTLMQMGRWFGYRPMYQDLCRIYMTESSRAYYENIALATEELKAEFKTMAKAKPTRTPMDFGLKVRNSEGGLLVTAKNKMRTAKEVIRDVDLTGEFNESYRLDARPKIVQQNLNAANDLYNELKNKESENLDTPFNTKHKLWKGVFTEYIIDFLGKFQNHPMSIKTDSDLVRNYIREFTNKTSINKLNIVFFNSGRKQNIKIKPFKSLGEINPSIREKNWKSIDDYIQLSQRSLSAENMRTIDLENGEDRTVPLLIIYLLDFRGKNEEPILENGAIGYAVSFPGREVVGHINITTSYQVNIPWFKEKYSTYQEDDEDLGDII